MDLSTVDDKKLRKALSKLSQKEVNYLLSDIEGYVAPLVDINQFINDPYYLGGTLRDEYGKQKLYTIWIDALNKIFPSPYHSPYSECLAGNTLIDLLDGRKLTIKEIVEEINQGKKLYTISYDIQNKRIVPGKLVAGKYKGKKLIYKITLDNGDSFEATDNHLILTVDKKYKRIDCLKVGSKLLPFNMKMSGKYKEIRDPDTGIWNKLYDVIYDWKTLGVKTKNTQTHHKDSNSVNDAPENLCRVPWKNHFKYHSLKMTNMWDDPAKRCELIDKLSKGQKLIYDKDVITKYFDSTDEFEDCVKSHNHRIIKIEKVGIKEVYDIEVEKYNNFALSCGVFSHNCAFGGSIGQGKCLSGSTRVPTSLGLLTLEELYKIKQKGKSIYTLTEGGLNEVIDVIDNGIKPVLNICTQSGKVLNPTSDHKFRVLTPDFKIEWKRAGDIRLGDYFVASRELSCFGTHRLEKGLAYLMGVLIGDGSFAHTNNKPQSTDRCDIRITVGNKTYVEELDFMEEITYLFHKYVGFNIWRKTKCAYYISKINHDFCSRMVSWNSWTKDYIKKVPSIIYKGCQKDVIDFIAGLIDTDGHVDSLNGCIDLCFKSEYLVDGLVSLFSAMGLQTKRSVKQVKGKNYWRVKVTGKSSLIRLRDLGLRLRVSYKQLNFEKLINRPYHRNERSIVPYARVFIKQLRDSYIVPKRSKVNNLFGAAHNNQNVSVETLKKLDNICDIDNPTVRYILDHDAYFEKVVNIEKGNKVQTYDLSCEQSHSYRVEGIITHNSTIARIILMYDTYKLLMLRNPFSKYSLIATDSIIIALFTANLKLANLVLYAPFRELVKNSPFFQQKLSGRRKLEEGGAVEFVNNISILAGSRFTHALGLATMSGMLDELNFQIQGEVVNQAMDSYTSLSRRMKSRFMEYGGGLPGHLLLISSKKDENAFLEKHIDENKNEPHFISFEYPLWEAHKDKGIYSGVTFQVFSGSPLQSPKIIEEGNTVKYPPDKILDVPIEYIKEFKTNIERALADIAGAGTISSAKYITFPENITKSIRLVHCANVKDYVILDFHDDTRVIEFVDVQKLKLYLNLLANSPRYIHIDIGITGDALGIAMSSVSGMREVERFDINEIGDDNSNTGIVMRSEPIIRTELALGIKSMTRVPLWKIRDFIVDLTELGFPITKVTADTYQSEDTLQLMAKMGYEVDVLSLDTSKDPHITFRNALYEGRCELPDYQVMVDELVALVDKGKKFDHPAGIGSSKDVSDAIIGSHYTAFQESGNLIDFQ